MIDFRCIAAFVVTGWIASGCGPAVPDADESRAALLYSCPLEGLTADERAAAGIQHVECRRSADGDPRHDYSYAVGCYDCPGAVYLADGTLTNGPSLTHTPTGWKLLVPANWNKRIVARVPGGFATLVPPELFFDMLLAEGYAVVTMYHATPFTAEVPLPPPDFHPREFGDAFLGAGVHLRALVSALFAPVKRFYAFGFSGGMASGIGPLLTRADSPFDGYVVGSSGRGRLFRMALNDRIWHSALSGQKQPCVDRGTQVSNLTEFAAQNLLRVDIRYFDPFYSGSAFGYDLALQTESVQLAAAATIVGTDLQRPTIYVHGLLDGVVPPILASQFIAEVVRAGKGDLVRPYFLKTRAHSGGGPIAQPMILEPTYYDLIVELDRWVRGDDEPKAVREVIATDGTTLREEPGCRARLKDAWWDATQCQESPYDFDAPDLQACPSPDDPRVQSCPAWACFFAVQQGE